MNNIFTNDFSKEVWQTTFKDHKDNTIQDTFRRVAKKVAEAEPLESRELWEKRFYSILDNFKFVPGGRIYANCGTEWKGTTWHNCFVGPKPSFDRDSLDGIFDVLISQAKTLKAEGGWGYNFSFIRPRGSFIYGVGVETPGAVKYMELFDKSSDIITAGSGRKNTKGNAKNKIRKGAMMALLDCWHPDIEEFITAKRKEGRLSKFNISVGFYNDFMDKVVAAQKLLDEGKEIPDDLNKWDLVFPDTQHPKYKEEWDGDIYEWKEKGYPVVVYKTVKVMDLWNSVMESTYNYNDPGCLFVDRANETHCWNYGGSKAKIRATNPCAEQFLPFGSNCDLGSLNLVMFYNEGKFNWDVFKSHIRDAVRFLDNVNEISPSPLPEYKDSMLHRRRIGLGLFGWASLLYLMKIRFASKEAENFKEKLMKIFTETAVEASINLAVEKGHFRDCDREKHANHPFWKKIKISDALIERIRNYGIRNSSLFSIQPTGNTSITANNSSSGIEPIFAHEIIRTIILNAPPDEIKDLIPKFYEGDFSPNEHFKEVKEGRDVVLRYKHTDGTVYKIDKNRGLTKEVLCEDFAVKCLKDIGEWNPKADWAVTTYDLKVDDHVIDLNGFAKWLDSSISKTVNVPKDYPYDDFKRLYLRGYIDGNVKGITTYREGTMANVLSVKKEESTEVKHAPKRPKELSCDIYISSVNKEKFFILIGKYDDKPYEVFAGRLDFELDSHQKSGIIKKEARGRYSLSVDGEVVCKNIIDHLDDAQQVITRLTSTNLRHAACDLSFLVQQLLKSQGDMTSLGKVIARCLKHYIKEGTVVSGEECQSCGGKLVFAEGCQRCSSCSYTKCS